MVVVVVGQVVPMSPARARSTSVAVVVVVVVVLQSVQTEQPEHQVVTQVPPAQQLPAGLVVLQSLLLVRAEQVVPLVHLDPVALLARQQSKASLRQAGSLATM